MARLSLTIKQIEALLAAIPQPVSIHNVDLFNAECRLKRALKRAICNKEPGWDIDRTTFTGRIRYVFK